MRARRARATRRRRIVGIVLAACLAGCRSGPPAGDLTVSSYRRQLLARLEHEPQEVHAAAAESAPLVLNVPRVAVPASTQPAVPARESLLTYPATTSQPAPAEVLEQIPDPSEADEVLRRRLAEIERTAREARTIHNYRRMYEKAREYLSWMHLKDQVPLSLEACIRRALEHNYQIEIESYTPAISRTQLVEAEAAFDAEFFLNFGYNDIDRPVPTQLASGQSDVRNWGGGFRQLLPSGMRVETSLSQQRTFQNFQFQTINPAYESTFTAQFTQPLMRGFGLDVNRSQIVIRRNDLKIGREQFVQRVRDTLSQVEQAYWNLFFARRNVMITAITVAQNWVTYENMAQRLVLNVSPVEVNNSRSRWEARQVELLEAIRAVRDAEDQLKNLLNDPELLLSRTVEIIPTDVPLVAPVAIDHLEAVTTALKRRSEIRQARARIEQARVQTHVAKNQTLPQLDLAFNYQVAGLNVSADTSFDNLTTNRFRSYSVTLNFSYPLGNRAARAAWRRARMQEHQAVVALHQVMDQIVQQVNVAIRALVVRYRQLPSSLNSVQAAERNLRALQARAERIDPNYLETELSAIENLANTRRALLQVVRDYQLALVELERTRGTLLDAYHITVADEPAGP